MQGELEEAVEEAKTAEAELETVSVDEEADAEETVTEE